VIFLRNIVAASVFFAVLAFVVITGADGRSEHRRHLSPAQLEDAFRCIHRHEGAWTSNTGNGYYGGLQMDMSFQRTYGPAFLAMWGKAHRWPAYVQISVAMRAYATRGFGPWPNTRRMCGV
jgi:hypothetical protein